MRKPSVPLTPPPGAYPPIVRAVRAYESMSNVSCENDRTKGKAMHILQALPELEPNYKNALWYMSAESVRVIKTGLLDNKGMDFVREAITRNLAPHRVRALYFSKTFIQDDRDVFEVTSTSFWGK